MVNVELDRAHALPLSALIASALLHHVYMHLKVHQYQNLVLNDCVSPPFTHSQVVQGRNRFKIRYPDLYATSENCPDEKASLIIRIQLSHDYSGMPVRSTFLHPRRHGCTSTVSSELIRTHWRISRSFSSCSRPLAYVTPLQLVS